MRSRFSAPRIRARRLSRQLPPRRWASVVVGVLLLAGCAAGTARERVPMAAHGIGRLAYKQLVAVTRAALEPAPRPAFAQDPPDAEDPPGDPAPVVGTTRTDVPPGSWVAAFPAPDLEPTPSPPAPVERAAADEAPEQVAAELPRPPRPAPEPQIEPRAIDEPAPTAGDVEGTQAPGQPSPLAPVVAVVIAPIIVGIVPVIPHAPGRPRLGATPSVRPGGVRVASPRGARR